jgi:hypothetical protein
VRERVLGQTFWLEQKLRFQRARERMNLKKQLL